MAVMAAQKRIPLPGLSVQMIFQKDRIRGLVGFLAQRHVGFFGGILSFFRIAFFTGGNQVHPCIDTAAGTRGNVIDGEVLAGTAILAFMIVALEYILPGKINALVGGVNISVQADDGRHRVALRHRMQFVTVGRSYHFTFVQKNQNEGTLDGANHEWTVVLIQYQHPAIHK